MLEKREDSTCCLLLITSAGKMIVQSVMPAMPPDTMVPTGPISSFVCPKEIGHEKVLSSGATYFSKIAYYDDYVHMTPSAGLFLCIWRKTQFQKFAQTQ